MSELRGSYPDSLGIACVGGPSGVEIAMFRWDPDNHDQLIWLGAERYSLKGKWYPAADEAVLKEFQKVIRKHFIVIGDDGEEWEAYNDEADIEVEWDNNGEDMD